MAIREILEVPDPRLKTVSTPVEPDEFNEDLKTLVEDMFETMYDAPGIGTLYSLLSDSCCDMDIDLPE